MTLPMVKIIDLQGFVYQVINSIFTPWETAISATLTENCKLCLVFCWCAQTIIHFSVHFIFPHRSSSFRENFDLRQCEVRTHCSNWSALIKALIPVLSSLLPSCDVSLVLLEWMCSVEVGAALVVVCNKAWTITHYSFSMEVAACCEWRHVGDFGCYFPWEVRAPYHWLVISSKTMTCGGLHRLCVTFVRRWVAQC